MNTPTCLHAASKLALTLRKQIKSIEPLPDETTSTMLFDNMRAIVLQMQVLGAPSCGIAEHHHSQLMQSLHETNNRTQKNWDRDYHHHCHHLHHHQDHMLEFRGDVNAHVKLETLKQRMPSTFQLGFRIAIE
jgi:hypothetical protein